MFSKFILYSCLKTGFIWVICPKQLDENMAIKETQANSKMCYLTSWQWRMSQEITTKCKNKESLAVWSTSVGQGEPHSTTASRTSPDHSTANADAHVWRPSTAKGKVLNHVAFSLINNREVWCLAPVYSILPGNQLLALQVQVNISGRGPERLLWEGVSPALSHGTW